MPVLFWLFLVTFVAYPALFLLAKSFSNAGQFSLHQFATLFEDAYWRKVTLGSIGLGLGVSLCSSLLGLIMATVVNKTSLPLRRCFMAMAVLPMIFPGFVTSLSYIFLFGRNGLITYQWLNISWNIYGWPSVFILQTLSFSTTSFLLILAALSTVDSALEDSARNLGASEWGVFGSVTLPLIMPGIISAMLLTFLRSMADFGTPYIMGGRFNTLATASYSQLIGVYNAELAAALNVILLIFSMAVFVVYTRVQKRAHYQRTSELRTRAKNIAFPPILAAVMWLITLVYALMITSFIVSIFLAAFTLHLGGDFGLTLEHFAMIPRRGWGSIVITIYFASITSLVMGLFSIVLAYQVSRLKWRSMKLLDMFATLPFAIPGTFMGLAYALAFNQPPLVISGTWLIVVLCTVVRELPLGLRAGVNVLDQQDLSVEQAAANLGDGAVGRFFRIVVPMARQALVVSMVYAFIITSKTLGAIIFIISPSNKVLAVDVFEATVRGEVGDAAALSIVVMLVAAAGVLLFGSLYKGNRSFLCFAAWRGNSERR